MDKIANSVPKVGDTCCCCFSLRTGGIIIGIISAMYPFSFGISGLIGAILAACYLYGISANKPRFMFPFLIYMWVATGVIAFVVIIFSGAVLVGHGAGFFHFFIPMKEGEEEGKEYEETIVIAMIALWIVFALSMVLQLYTTLVVQTLYVQMKENGHETLPTTNDGIANVHYTPNAPFENEKGPYMQSDQ